MTGAEYNGVFVTTSKPSAVLLRIIPHLAAIVVLALCLRLALWQLDRAEEKQLLIDQWESAPAGALSDFAGLDHFALASGVGRFDLQRHILLDNQTRNHQPGVHVITPFELDDGTLIMVNRGWQPWDRRSPAPPEFATPSGPVNISGRVSEPPRVGFQLGQPLPLNVESWPNLMTYYDTGLIAAALGRELTDRVLLLDPEHPAHLSGDAWPTVNMGPERHIGYAVQWVSIGSAVLFLWIFLSYRSLRRR